MHIDGYALALLLGIGVLSYLVICAAKCNFLAVRKIASCRKKKLGEDRSEKTWGAWGDITGEFCCSNL